MEDQECAVSMESFVGLNTKLYTYIRKKNVAIFEQLY